ncbi:MAG: argininosuccinate lyase [Clostridia bacterium]|nr:argininosuccinate lyase [Clostridia bacterium]
MDKNLWSARFSKELDALVNEFNQSIKVDSLMYAHDVMGSLAHAEMLKNQGIITELDFKEIENGLNDILKDIESGALKIDMNAEDIHMFIEGELTKRYPEAGKKLHTARSRNDQVAVDARLYLRDKTEEVMDSVKNLVGAIYEVALQNVDTVMPGYTHLQRAQPVTFAHHLMAYASMFMRDYDRLIDCKKRMNYSPLGSCALAGTTYPIDRSFTATKLGFTAPMFNSMDGVSDRDFAVELCSTIALIMMHLSRFSEEVILWSSWEYKFIELDDGYSTGSSIMPQKKNPDIAELVRGKTGRAYGNLITLLTLLKGLPLAYNKDMQEDKEAVFDSVETVLKCLNVFAPMLKTMTVLKENMAKAAEKGFINATDCADYLAKKGMPFRSAYKITGQLVALCINKGLTMGELPLADYKEYSDLFESDIYEAIDMSTCLNKRTSEGGPSAVAVLKQLKIVESFLND